MKRILIAAFAVLAACIASPAMALTASQNLTVQVNVIQSCNVITATALDFGSYDPSSPTALDGSTTATFRCTKGTPYEYYITGARTMAAADASDNITFDLYSDAPGGTIFPSASGSGLTTGSPAASNAPTTVDIYGRIGTFQDAGAGAANPYTATLQFVVEY